MEYLIQAATVSKPSSPRPWPEVLRQAPEEPIKPRGSGHVCLGLPMSAMYKNIVGWGGGRLGSRVLWAQAGLSRAQLVLAQKLWGQGLQKSFTEKLP